MFGWVVRGLLVVAAAVTEFLVAVDAPHFGVVQGMVSIALIAVVVAVVALWPRRGRRGGRSVER